MSLAAVTSVHAYSCVVVDPDASVVPAGHRRVERATVTAAVDARAPLAYGRGVQRTYLGDCKGAAAAFREVHRIDENFRVARTREFEALAIGAIGTANPIAIPGVPPLDRAISTAVDRLNRPLDLVTKVLRAVSTSIDPSFPNTKGIVVITVVRP